MTRMDGHADAGPDADSHVEAHTDAHADAGAQADVQADAWARAQAAWDARRDPLDDDELLAALQDDDGAARDLERVCELLDELEWRGRLAPDAVAPAAVVSKAIAPEAAALDGVAADLGAARRTPRVVVGLAAAVLVACAFGAWAWLADDAARPVDGAPRGPVATSTAGATPGALAEAPSDAAGARTPSEPSAPVPSVAPPDRRTADASPTPPGRVLHARMRIVQTRLLPGGRVMSSVTTPDGSRHVSYTSLDALR